MSIGVKAPTVANIRSFTTLSGGKAAKVLAITNKIETAAAYDAKIRDITGGKLEMIPGSLRVVTAKVQSAQPAINFGVRAVVESLPYEEAASMRTVVSANVFADSNEGIWSVREINGVKRLVANTDTDIGALLAHAASTNHSLVAASTYEQNGMQHFQNGNFVLFMHPETASMDAGVAVRGDDGALSVASIDTDAIVTIDDAAVVANAAYAAKPAVGEDGKEIASDTNFELAGVTSSPMSREGKANFLSFYQKLYGDKPEFWSQLRAMITKAFGLQ